VPQAGWLALGIALAAWGICLFKILTTSGGARLEWALYLAGAGALLAFTGFVRRNARQRTVQLLIDCAEILRMPACITDDAGQLISANSQWQSGPAAAPELALPPTTDRSADPTRIVAGDRVYEVRADPLPELSHLVLWQARDVTEQSAAEETVRREVQRLRGLLDQAPVGLYAVDGKGAFLFANATFAGWLGTTPASLTDPPRRLSDVLVTAPKEITDVPGGLDPDLANHWGVSADVTFRLDQAPPFHGSLLQTEQRDSAGRVYLACGLVWGQAPAQLWQDAFRQSEQRFQRFFEDAPIGIALVTEEGIIAECNPVFLEMVNADQSAVLGRPLTDRLAPRERDHLQERIHKAADAEEPSAPIDCWLQGKKPLLTQLYARRLGKAQAGVGTGYILHFLDMTERRSLETQFAQSQKMQAVGQLAGGVAHDFNNLLTAMIGFCDLLLLRHKPGDQSFADIMQIKQNANRAANLVRQLLAFSRQQTLQPRVIDVTDSLTELSHLLRRLIGENIELNMVHSRGLGPVKVDQVQLEQVVINLAVNARDAMPSGGKLTIQTRNLSLSQPVRQHEDDAEVPPGEYVAIEVGDTGVGITEKHLPHIFEPFFSTKAVGSGTGLGLSTVYGIVRQTGGYILVESKEGQGTTFTVLLPRHAGGRTETTQQQETRDRPVTDLTGSETILLVEDEDPVRLFSTRALRNKGYTVLEAKSGEAALQLITAARDRIDLLITDVVMPGLDGPSLIRAVRAQQPTLKVICISGYAEDRFREDLKDVQPIHYLAKPFSLKQLAGKVKDVLREDTPG